jgi:hypothetical protein
MDIVDKINIIGCSCGLCCDKPFPCAVCLRNTLLANGMSLDKIKEFKGLKHKASGCPDAYKHSELREAIRSYKQKH